MPYKTLSPLIVLSMFIALGCIGFPGTESNISLDPLGIEVTQFLNGLVHGYFLPASWIVSFFDSDTSIYDTAMSNSIYDDGFAIGSLMLVIIISQRKRMTR